MKALFDCDSLWCCWATLAQDIVHFFWLIRWPIAIYAALYALGAATFLLSLRFKSRDGRLIVDRRSWAYMIAHPMRYGGHRTHKGDQGSICAFYARMFNMLLFVWPFLLVWFALGTIFGSIVMFALAGRVIWPDLHESAFFDERSLTRVPLVVVTFPAVVLTLAILYRGAVLRWLTVAMWVVLCLSPALVAMVLAVAGYRKVRHPKTETALAVREVIDAQKHKFCKLIQFE